jgi:predicted HAD superfamily Cof-like phosphohydrolase
MKDPGMMIRQFHEKFGFPLDRKLSDENTQSDFGASSLMTSQALKQFGELLVEQAAAWQDEAIKQQEDGDGRLYSVHLMAEELGEWAIAMAEKNELKMAHELADLGYVVYGRSEQYNIPLTPVLAELHKSNMSKSVIGRRMRSRDQANTYLPPDIRGAVLEGRAARVGYTNVCMTGRFSSKEPNEANKPGVQPREKDTLYRQTKTMFAWVIEHQDSATSCPQYFTGDGWSAEHSKAIRFSRREDAERMGLNGHRICEHGWED